MDRKKEVSKMEWQVVVALIIAVPVILFPAAFVWYLNVGGLVAATKKVLARKVEVIPQNELTGN